MRQFVLVVLLACGLGMSAAADEITFTFLNFDASTFSASGAGLEFGNAINVLVTDNSNGKSMMLGAVDSGNTGAAGSFVAGPPLVAIYKDGGAGSVLIESGGALAEPKAIHVFLSGMMDKENELEAEYPERAGAFLSRFSVNFVDPGILTELGAGTVVAPDGSVSLTLAETSFDGVTLHAVLGGGAVTIETRAPVPESPSLFLLGAGILLAIRRGHALAGRRP